MKRFGFFLIAASLYAAVLVRDSIDQWVVSTDVPSLIIETSVEVLDRNGTLLRAYTVADGRWRLETTLEQVDPRYLEMLVAYEDKRFYRHSGVDSLAALRAAVQAVRSGRVVSGASTLTMQVARLLEDGPTGTWKGKLRQTRLALALERILSKEDVLTLYLNRAPFGGNLEGVRSASFAYFGKEPRRLTTAEAALLVALPQSPEQRRPDRFLGSALDARQRVLARLNATGLLDEERVAAALTEPLSGQRKSFPKQAAHLTDRLVKSRPGRNRHDTVLDAALQTRLERMAQRAAADAGQRLSIAIIVADHRDGAIRASIGSAGYRADDREGFVDMTQSVRSPGSTLKPLVYGLAFDQGLAHPETLIEDRPIAFGTYAPQNFDGTFRGTVRVRDALKLSLNVPVVALMEALGPARLMSHLRRARVDAEVPGAVPGLAVALGGIGVSLEGLVQLYASIAQAGRATQVSALPINQTLQAQVLSPEAAWHLGNILAETPPPTGAAQTGLAYKTGTSYGHRDAWAIGFDGAHVIGVWIGRPDGTSVPGAFGGSVAAPVLFEAFALLKPKLDRLPPPPPSTLIVSHGHLPQPLKRFRSRNAVFNPDVDAPKLVFPPDGARLKTVSAGGLIAKVQDGQPPFTWMADGAPILTRSHDRSVMLKISDRGFVTLSVVDAAGRAARSKIRLD